MAWRNSVRCVGRLHWVSPALDERTRMVQAHAEVPNRDGRLKAKAFGTAAVTVRSAPRAVVVPESAVQWEGSSFVVFVRAGEREFRVRRVNPAVPSPRPRQIRQRVRRVTGPKNFRLSPLRAIGVVN